MEKGSEIPNTKNEVGGKKKKKKSKKKGITATAATPADRANDEGGKAGKSRKQKKKNKQDLTGTSKTQEKQKAKTPDKNNLSKGSVGKMNERMSDWTRGGGGWSQQSRDHQGPSPWNFGWNNAGCKSSQMTQFCRRYLVF